MKESPIQTAGANEGDRLFRLEDKVAIVTGALGLLGREHCKALALAGARVVVTDRDAEGCRRFASELSAMTGQQALGHGADISQKSSIENLRDATLAFGGGRIDVLVNNAAIDDKFETPAAAAERSRFEAYPLELWNASLNVNVTGTFLCCQILGSPMASAGRGSIINVASTYGLVAPDQSLYLKPDGSRTFYKSPAYPVTKAAVLGLTRFLAAYWGPKGVRVNALCPGGVENGQDPYFQERYGSRTPLGRMAHRTDYRGAVVYLASDASSYMTGASLVVDGGFTVW